MNFIRSCTLLFRKAIKKLLLSTMAFSIIAIFLSIEIFFVPQNDIDLFETAKIACKKYESSIPFFCTSISIMHYLPARREYLRKLIIELDRSTFISEILVGCYSSETCEGVLYTAKVRILTFHSKSLLTRFMIPLYSACKVTIFIDDDIFVTTSELEKLWKANLKFKTLISPFVRLWKEEDEYGYFELSSMQSRYSYSFALTKLLISETKYVYQYLCRNPPKHFAPVLKYNQCEDISFNFFFLNFTNLCPRHVPISTIDFGDSTAPRAMQGISLRFSEGEHLRQRSNCIKSFKKIFSMSRERAICTRSYSKPAQLTG